MIKSLRTLFHRDHPHRMLVTVVVIIVVLLVMAWIQSITGNNGFIQDVKLSPYQIAITLKNHDSHPVTVAQILVNEAFWQFSADPSQTLLPNQQSTIHIQYPWEEGRSYSLLLLMSDGSMIEKTFQGHAS